MMTTRRAGQRLSFFLVAAVALGPIAACSDDEPKKGEAEFEVDGAAVIERQAGEREEVDDRTDIRVGDELTIVEGVGTLTLPGGVTYELRAGLGGSEASKLLMGPTPELLAGDVLVIAPDGTQLEVGGTSVQVDGGAAQVSKPAGAEVAVAAYDTGVHIDSAGQLREFKALREMQVPAVGVPPDAARPLVYDGSDPWDRRFLGEAIDLGARLQALAAGYTQNLSRGQGRTVEFFEQVLPGLADEPEFTEELLDRDRDAGETLVGAAITDLGRRGTFAERWQAVFAFRGDGAAWGLVALDQGVDSLPLLGAVTDAVDSSPLAIGPTRPPRPATGSSTTTPTTVASSGGATPTTTPTTRPPATPPAGGSGGGLLGPLVSPLTPVVQPIAEVLGGLLSGLLGGLLGG